jgi:protein-L-isoaspartate(D-aspartate) O-methyltransferase
MLLGSCAGAGSSLAEPPQEGNEDLWAEARTRMVQHQIAQPRDGRAAVTNPSVVKALGKVERHRFVPADYRHLAYEDRPLPIGHNQTISQPYIVAVMTELLAPQPGHKILEVGTGSGYQAAVLAELVSQVYTIEIVAPLAQRAGRDLKAAGYKNVFVRAGDGYLGWPERAPFDGIVVTAAPDHVPQPLIDQLKVGGRLVIPVGPQSWLGQELVVLEKQVDGTAKRSRVMSVRFVPLTGDHAEGRPPSPESTP